MAIDYRLADGSDYDHDAVVRIGKAIRPDEYISATDLTDWETVQADAGRAQKRWLAAVDGEIVGSGAFGQTPWLSRDHFFAHVMIHPDHQRRGIGRALIRRVEGSAVELGAGRIVGSVADTQERAIRIVEEAGYSEFDRDWESALDLDAFDASAWSGTIASVIESGIRIVSLTELAATRTWWKQDLHQLYIELEADVPTELDIQPVPFDDFEKLMLGRQSLADGFLIALDGDDLVGLTEPRSVDDEPTAVAQELTGVVESHRGRGIATSLKVAAAIWAKDRGYRTIRTYNAQRNAPMLAVNTKLGFVRGPAQIEYVKQF